MTISKFLQGKVQRFGVSLVLRFVKTSRTDRNSDVSLNFLHMNKRTVTSQQALSPLPQPLQSNLSEGNYSTHHDG